MRRMRQPEITFPFLQPDAVKSEHRTEREIRYSDRSDERPD